MKLAQLINIRGNKFAEDVKYSCTDFHKGYMEGWRWAYKDLKEILEQNGFDMNVVVIKKGGEE